MTARPSPPTGRASPPAAWRVAIALATLILAGVVCAQAIAQVAGPRRPTLATVLWPWSGLAQARMGELSVDPETLTVVPAARAWARRALASEPLAVNAVRTIGQRQQVEGRVADARRTMALAADLSRRDVPTQSWMIREAVADNDLDAVLDHYDTALRGSLSAKRLLTPALVKAIAVPGAVAPFARLVDRHPPWFPGYVRSVAATGSTDAAANMAGVLLARPEQMARVERPTLALLVAKLAEGGRFAAAERIYTGLPDRAATDGLRWPDFQVADAVPPFDWTATTDTAASADPVRSGLAVLVTQPGDHVAAEQLLSLAPGRWTLTGGLRPSAGRTALAEWRLSCAIGGGALGRADARTGAPGVLQVPRGCPYQWLRLAVRRGGDEALELVATPLSLRR